jgi:hypothetical protein
VLQYGPLRYPIILWAKIQHDTSLFGRLRLSLHEDWEFSGGVALCFGPFEPLPKVLPVEAPHNDLGLGPADRLKALPVASKWSQSIHDFAEVIRQAQIKPRLVDGPFEIAGVPRPIPEHQEGASHSQKLSVRRAASITTFALMADGFIADIFAAPAGATSLASPEVASIHLAPKAVCKYLQTLLRRSGHDVGSPIFDRSTTARDCSQIAYRTTDCCKSLPFCYNIRRASLQLFEDTFHRRVFYVEDCSLDAACCPKETRSGQN